MKIRSQNFQFSSAQKQKHQETLANYFFRARELHRNSANWRKPFLVGDFESSNVLFHTVFNRTVENFHRTVTFHSPFAVRMAFRLHREKPFASPNPAEQLPFFLSRWRRTPFHDRERIRVLCRRAIIPFRSRALSHLR